MENGGCVDEAFVVAVKRQDTAAPSLSKVLGHAEYKAPVAAILFHDLKDAVKRRDDANEQFRGAGMAPFAVFRAEVRICEEIKTV